MDLADLLMNYPRVQQQVEEFQAECQETDFRQYQVKWRFPRFFPFTVRCDLRYLPSKKNGRYTKVLPLAIRT